MLLILVRLDTLRGYGCKKMQNLSDDCKCLFAEGNRAVKAVLEVADIKCER